jgi:hypothetical protein
MVYSLVSLSDFCTQATANKAETWHLKAAFAVDCILIVSLLALGILSSLAQIQALYSLAAYSFEISVVSFGSCILISLLDLALFLIKKRWPPAKIATPPPVAPPADNTSIPVIQSSAGGNAPPSQAGTPLKALDKDRSEAPIFAPTVEQQCMEGFEQLYALRKVEIAGQLAPDTPELLLDWFYRKINEKSEGKHPLCAIILQYIVWVYDTETECVRSVVFDKNDNVTSSAIGSILQHLGLIKVPINPSSADLEKEIKNALKEKYAIDEPNSPVAFSDWDEIPLSNLLILSDKCFYDLRPNSSDYIYLHRQFAEGGKKETLKKTQYTDEDQKKFEARVKKLKLTAEEAKIAPQREKPRSNPMPPPYLSLEWMIKDIVNTKEENLHSAIIPYLEILEEPSLQRLKIPGLGNRSLGHVRTDIYAMDLHVFAIHLWNALMSVGYHPEEPPTDSLKGAARYHHISLLDNRLII